MIPEFLKGPEISWYNDIEWEEYLNKIGEYTNRIDNYFLSQICYEHYSRFNEYFPLFDIKKNKIIRIQMTAKKIYEKIRHDEASPLEWSFHIDEYFENGNEREGYFVMKYCIEKKTWPFPPVIISNKIGNELGNMILGSPLHLIEGTHRISYINRLLELNYLNPMSLHQLVLIK